MSLDKDVKGVWKVKKRGTTKSTSPPLTIGLIYRGKDSTSVNLIEGMLLEILSENDEVILKTREGKFVSVDKKSLKIHGFR